MEKSSFFNSISGDRKYYAEDWAEFLTVFFTNGIFNNELQVLANNNDMTITIEAGNANINGYRYKNTTDLIKSIDVADGVLNRIDNVVIRLDLTNRLISAQIIKGTPAETPTAPDLVRNSTTYDLRIATISIPHGTETITQDLVTDTRFITSDCGNVIATVQTPDTEALFIQLQASAALVIAAMQADEAQLQEDAASLLSDIQDDFDTFISTSTTTFNGKITEFTSTFNTTITGFDTVFNTWFNSIKDQIDDDLGASLQLQINQIKATYVNDANYVHTDNNYSNAEKQKVTAATNNITTLATGLLKRYTTTLQVANWTQNSTTNLYEYDIINNEIVSDTVVDVILTVSNLDKMSDSSVESFSGHFTIYAKECPTENIPAEIRYQLSNITLGGD